MPAFWLTLSITDFHLFWKQISAVNQKAKQFRAKLVKAVHLAHHLALAARRAHRRRPVAAKANDAGCGRGDTTDRPPPVAEEPLDGAAAGRVVSIDSWSRGRVTVVRGRWRRSVAVQAVQHRLRSGAVHLRCRRGVIYGVSGHPCLVPSGNAQCVSATGQDPSVCTAPVRALSCSPLNLRRLSAAIAVFVRVASLLQQIQV